MKLISNISVYILQDSYKVLCTMVLGFKYYEHHSKLKSSIYVNYNEYVSLTHQSILVYNIPY